VADPWPDPLSPLTRRELDGLGLGEADLKAARPAWRRVGSRVILFAASESGRWWVLRLNDFPDHPLFTLFVEGRRICDMNDPPREWALQPYGALPVLEERQQAHVLDVMRSFGPYGSEVGVPCDGDWCNCSKRDEAFVTESIPPIGS
jgi:hypothetical protein